jgi:hypothetical protein
MIYSFREWLNKVLPYPTLSKEVGTVHIINDIIDTHVPDVIFGCTPNKDPMFVNLQPYLCFIDNNNELSFNDSASDISTFKSNIPKLSIEDQDILDKRCEKKQK